MIFERREISTVLKRDCQVVRDLEDALYQSLREAQTAIKEGDEEMAVEQLVYAQTLKKLRGYETISDKKYTEVFDEYFDRFLDEKASLVN